MTDGGLLEPGAHRARGVVDDAALVSAMLRVEVAWMQALADGGAAKADHVDAVARAVPQVAAGPGPDRGRGRRQPGAAAGACPPRSGRRPRRRPAAARRPHQPGRARHGADAARAGRDGQAARGPGPYGAGAGPARRRAPGLPDGRTDADAVRRPLDLRAQGRPVADRRAGRRRPPRRRTTLAAGPVRRCRRDALAGCGPGAGPGRAAAALADRLGLAGPACRGTPGGHR